MSDQKVLLSVDGGVGLITLNRPESRNAIDTGTADGLRSLLRSIASSDEVRVAVLTGAGTAFCAGADLKQRRGMTPQEVAEHTESILECTNLLEELPVPVIGAINGPAHAGGMEIALACDFRIASQAATFALPEITLGIFPGAGAPIRLPRLVGKGRAKLLVLSGNKITAEDAYRIGLVEMLSPGDRLMEDAMGLARRIARYNPRAVRAAKSLMNLVEEVPHSAAVALSSALRHPLNTAPEWIENLESFGRRRP